MAKRLELEIRCRLGVVWEAEAPRDICSRASCVVSHRTKHGRWTTPTSPAASTRSSRAGLLQIEQLRSSCDRRRGSDAGTATGLGQPTSAFCDRSRAVFRLVALIAPPRRHRAASAETGRRGVPRRAGGGRTGARRGRAANETPRLGSPRGRCSPAEARRPELVLRFKCNWGPDRARRGDRCDRGRCGQPAGPRPHRSGGAASAAVGLCLFCARSARLLSSSRAVLFAIASMSTP